MTNPQPRDYAIVVGIDDYPRYGKNGRNLRGAVRDAKLFHAWLIDQETGGGLDPDHCRLITSQGDPMALTQMTVDLVLDELWTMARDAGGGRRFYFFFSGHGQSVVGADAVTYDQSLCLPQWSQTMPHAALNADSYPNVVQTCMPFQEIVMFLDCCRVPAIKVRAINSTVGCTTPLDGFDHVNKMVYFAAEPMRRAFEGQLDDAPEDAEPEVHGYFTTALLEGLQKGSGRAGGGVGAETLWDHLEYRVPQLADGKSRRQIPRRSPTLFSDDVVFGAAGGDTKPISPAAGDQTNFEIRFSDARVGPVRLVDADANPLRDGDTSTGPWKVNLEPNAMYLLIDDGNDQQRAFVFLPAMEGKHDTF
ncbi:caspase family protein [Phaeobacter marinintestinus]|uniref:caspase family protein n=1 Tax=Falsiphaeobacter marinintestinus TaxID=1492905 RepID=UPI0011B6F9E2|nr:caspase family protein [Phaeobacter marinintestinus]